jgi:two-component system LytT family sensor kinase
MIPIAAPDAERPPASGEAAVRARADAAADPERVRLPRACIYAAAFAVYTVLACLDAPFTHLYAANVGSHETWLYDIVVTTPGWYVRCLLIPVPILLTEHFPLDRTRWRRHLPAHVVGATLCGLGWVLLGSFISDRVLVPLLGFPRLHVPYWTHAYRLATSTYCAELGMYGLLAGALHALHFSRLAVERQRAAGELALRASRLETSLAQANLSALSMQLRPHFLFNTLNAVTVLAMKGRSADVVRVLGWLSALLRSSLATGPHRITLRRELRFARRYLSIEQMRFGDRLRVRFQVESGVLDAQVPSFVLQPLVENSIRHGIARRRGAGRIRVCARRDGDRLELTVSDNGPGFGGGGQTAGTGLGLANTRARLELHYGSAFQLLPASRARGGAEVRVVLPFQTAAPGVGDAAENQAEQTSAA